MQAISSTNTIGQTITIGEKKQLNKKTIENKTIGLETSVILNKPQDVDVLLQEFSDLITPDFIPYFAKMFAIIPRNRLFILAGQAKVDYKTTPQKLFAYLISREAKMQWN